MYISVAGLSKFKIILISRLPVLAAPSGSKLKAGICTENVNVSSDVNPTTNVEEMDSDDQEDNNLSCLENEIIIDDNLSNV